MVSNSYFMSCLVSAFLHVFSYLFVFYIVIEASCNTVDIYSLFHDIYLHISSTMYQNANILKPHHLFYYLVFCFQLIFCWLFWCGHIYVSLLRWIGFKIYPVHTVSITSSITILTTMGLRESPCVISCLTGIHSVSSPSTLPSIVLLPQIFL